MTENLDERISYHESPTYEIARKLKDKGYQIADFAGIRVSEPQHDVLGILEPRDPIEKSFLGFKRNKKQRALYIGTLWINNQERGAKSDENWVLEAYGRNNVPKLTELVRELSESKGVSVQVRLEREQSRVEMYVSDYGF